MKQTSFACFIHVKSKKRLAFLRNMF